MFSSLSGQLLVSCDPPSAEIDSLTGSVIYVHQHNAKGAVGFILNKILADTASLLTHVLRAKEPISAMDGCDLSFGGPVSLNRLSVLCSHDCRVQIIQSRAAIERFAEGGVPFHHFLCLLGHSAWGEGQLESEILAHRWQPVPLSVEAVLRSPTSSVNQLINRAYDTQPGCLYIDYCGRV